MFTLYRGGWCYAPEELGKKDVLVGMGKICRIADYIPPEQLWQVEVVDCTDCWVCPGWIDQHVHITGGGGEEGPASRIPEILLSDITQAGVTTVVGLLGADGLTRSMENLLSKAKALELEGISTYVYTGCYGIPPVTLTGSVLSDITFIEKVLGCGEIAISDYRSSHPTLQTLKELAYEVKLGGMLGGKAGIMHMHLGDGKEGLAPLLELVAHSDYPVDMFIPTHINRSKRLFEEGIQYVKSGGYMDLTAGQSSETGVSIPEAVDFLLSQGLDIKHITVSSDGNGSIPPNSGTTEKVGKVRQLYDDIKSCVMEKKLHPAAALSLVTSNAARNLRLFPMKGTLQVGCDGDVMVLDRDFEIAYLMAKGAFLIHHGKVVRKGRYETDG